MAEVPFRPLKPLETTTPGRFSRVSTETNGTGRRPLVVKEVLGLMRPGAGGLPVGGYNYAQFRDEVVKPAQAVLSPDSGLARFIPRTLFTWGKNESGDDAGFIVMDKVTGTDIGELTALDPKMAANLDSLLAEGFLAEKSLGVHLDIYTRQGELQNIITGLVQGQTEEMPWMTDLYPMAYQRHHTDDTKNLLLRNIRAKYKYPFSATEEALEATGVMTDRRIKQWEKETGKKW